MKTANKTQRVFVLSEHYAPSTGATAQLITDLVEDLCLQGVPITVLTSSPGKNNYLYPVYRITTVNTSSVSIVSKILNGIHFFFSSLQWLVRNSSERDVLVIVSNPPFIGLVGLIIRALRGINYIFIFQDLFPRSAVLTGVLPPKGLITLGWKLILAKVIHHSEMTVVLSDSMLKRCESEFGALPNLTCIHNWSIIPFNDSNKRPTYGIHRQLQPNNEFTVQYSGNFGRLHEILLILEAARCLRRNNIKFEFIGGGAKKKQILAYKECFDLRNINIKPYQERKDLPISLASCDMSIISLIPGAEDTVAPSKLYGILSAGKPIILIASPFAEIAQFVTKHNCGIVVEHGDVTQLVNHILECSQDTNSTQRMAAASSQAYKQCFGKQKSVTQYHQIIQNTLGKSHE